jgi:Yip1-like protein
MCYLVVTNSPSSGDAMAMMLIDINRVKSILLQPGGTWKEINGEFAKPAQLYRGWILPLAVIWPLAQAIGTTVFGLRLSFGTATYSVPMSSIVTQAAAGYILNVVVIFFLALLINGLASSFGATKNDVQALKVAAYSSTAWLVAGVFMLVPSLALVAWLVALYSAYLLFSGMPLLMKVPQDRALGYVVVVIIIAVVIMLVREMISASFLPSFSELRIRS